MGWDSTDDSFDLSTYLREVAAECSPTCCSATASSGPARSSPTPGRESSSDRGTGYSRRSRSGTTSGPSTGGPGGGSWTSSPGDSPARTSAPPEMGPESRASEAAFGEKWQELFVRYDRDSSSWRTHQCLWDEALPWSSVTLPNAGTMRSGFVYQPRRSFSISEILPFTTSATGSGSSRKLPTPCAMEPEKNLESFEAKRALPRSQRGGGHGPNLATALKKLPTPNQRDWKDTGPAQGNRKSPNLGTVVHRKLPSPRAQEPGSTSEGYGIGLAELLEQKSEKARRRKLPTVTQTDARRGVESQEARLRRGAHTGVTLNDALQAPGGSLNPPWVEWLMGWPIGWSDSEPLEMDRFRSWLRLHGGLF